MLDNLPKSCDTILAGAEDIPLPSNEIDFITTFNAIHHFDFTGFLKECCRLLKPQGLLFIYTRTPEQNAETIWGTYFPMFQEVETRLLTQEALTNITSIFGFDNLLTKEFCYPREAPLEELISRACSFHYSTFRLIPESKFEECLETFKKNILEAGMDPNRIRWVDKNLLLIWRKS